MAENGGIIALSGFTFQIKVFFYFLTLLQEHQSVSFEFVDDVTITNYQASDLDRNQDIFLTRFMDKEAHKFIQVKRNTINPSKFQKILYNWLLIEGSELQVESYILCTLNTVDDKGDFFGESKTVYDEIMQTRKRSDATIAKVKELYKDNFPSFDENYKLIKSKYMLMEDFVVDDEIYTQYKVFLRRTTLTENIYKLRVEELLRNIQYDLLDSINKQNPYDCSYERFISHVEDVCEKVKVDEIELNYFAFLCSANLNVEEVKPNREYKQLEFCKKSEKFIMRHIMYGLYYSNYRNLSLENNKSSRISSIELRTYEGYEDVVDRLQEEKKDMPFKRLNECKKESNNYIKTDEAKYGALIFMTRESEVNQQLSWKEDTDGNDD